EVYGTKVHTALIESGTEARPGKNRKIKYIVIHETDNTSKGADAKNHSEFLSKNNKTSTSWHYTVDQKEIYHHIPDNEVAHHAATEKGNLYGIGIELCVNEDGNFEKTFENGAKLVAYLLQEYNLEINDIKTHNDFSGKDCPHNILKANRMEEFKSKVKSYL
ncbi:MAG: N-acetylmuramoyl-L-alanine amidase, partial [Clostridia bacterium]|nr:N-acetylmuramoyl-L-alanine amidase [Clostridia bacterium]